MLEIPLEDLAEDIISKAQRGLEIPTEDLAEISGLSRTEISDARKGQATEETILRIATPLGLHPQKLKNIWDGSWYPENQEIPNLHQINTAFYDMTVNCFIYCLPDSKEAFLFDTGVDPVPVIKCLEKNALTLTAIFITHTHRDHIEALAPIIEATKCPQIYSPEKELVSVDSISVADNQRISINDSINITAIETSGHSVGGISYLINTHTPICFVGDSIFAGSMGGGMISYQDAIRNNKEKLLSLPKNTLLCPGHGPITTVKQEKENNPFF